MAKKLTSTKAKKILHDKTVHGKPLTDKQRKFFGAVASGAIPQAQNGIEGTMGGLTDKGFNYNGAWGGTMQMGGAMPGAVGFTYARVAGAAPANGPYAKKTKASAQSGKKVKEDSNLENIVEIIDPTGVTSWDDVYRSYKKTGMSPETGLEIFGALPMIGKVGKIGKFAEAAAKTFAATGRQKRNAKAVAETLKGVGKYGPTAGRSTDAYQTYDQWENGGSMKYYQAGLDFKPKTISQDGSIISPLGQWAYPGEITTIPSNEITMQGVPYPVLGISDIGDTQMMYPGEDYTFDGDYVTEYPMMQKGGRVPIYVDDPKDPRLLAYQDSLYLTKAPMEAYKRSETIGKLIEQGNFDKANKLLHSGYIFSANARKALDRLTKYNKKEPKPIKGIEMGWGLSPIDDSGPVYKKPVQPVKYRKPEPKKEQPKSTPTIVERKQNVYEGSPVYSGTVGSGGPSALVGFVNQKGDTTYIKPEDYERFGVPKYGKEFIEKKKMKYGGVSVNEADAQPIKKLDQLLNFTNYNDMAKAKKGKKLSKAELGDSLTSINSALGDMGGIGGASSQLLGGIQLLMEEQRQKKKTKQFAALSDLSSKAATTRPVGIERKYVRPEDMLVDPGQVSSPYGTGMDFLQMEHGGFIGGNPTEIQNMYNPGDLYSDLGYEPLNDSNQVKQFSYGGKAQFGTVQAGQLGSTLGSLLGGGGGQQSGAGQIGSTLGGVAGTILLPGIGGPIGSALGGVIGGAIGGQSQKKMEQMQRRAQGNLGVAAMQQSLQGQFSGFMEDGGELKYLSHTWQPQKIAKFGEYDIDDLLAPPKDADMLRAGGHLKAYTPPSEAAMSTERPAMQMGGELQTFWGGYAEPISQNPYLPDGGETVMFRGQSHEESDGQGRTGIGIKFGDNPVEVERGEPAVKLKDGGTGQDSLVVYGNMKIPSYGASELGDPKAKGMKFKRYAEDLSKIETKANKTTDKAQSILENTDGNDPFSLLSMSTANIMMKGSDMKLKEAAMKKQLAAGIQSAILDTAEEMGLENDALAKGKIKKAKGGGKFTSAQVGINQPLTPIFPARQTSSFLQTTPAVQELMKQQRQQVPAKTNRFSKVDNNKSIKMDMSPFMPTTQQDVQMDVAFRAANPEQLSTYVAPNIFDSLVGSDGPSSGRPIIETQQPKGEKFNVLDLASQLNPFIRPLLRNPLDPGQLAPEMMALATNVVEPVQAQQFRPMLEEVPTVSFQDQLNEIQAEANAARRLAGNNPAAQSAIAAQAAAAKNKVLGEQTRMNQMMQLESRRRNLATLNDATLKNLAILDQQFTRQAQARSATKAQAQVALSSIADKIARNKAETLQANVMSNMYPQFTFGPKGRIFNTGLTTYNIPNISDYTSEEILKLADAKKLEESKGKSSKQKRNGSIVKAIKNL